MKFDKGIKTKYRKSVEDAFDTITKIGNEEHRMVLGEILKSNMLVSVKPVSEVKASGITGLINMVKTNYRLATERLSLRDALDEIQITIAEETIDTGGQRGCEGTFVHEGRHAYDFAATLSSMSNADMNPLEVFNPTLYELEWNAHKTAGDYMLCMNKQEYLDEGLQLMILGLGVSGTCFVNDDGIRQRLNDSYGLQETGNQGKTATEMMGIIV